MVIDGLDEIYDSADDLVLCLQRFQKCSRLRLCVSSRPERAFVDFLRSSSHLKLQDITQSDIRQVAYDKLEPLRRELNGPSTNGRDGIAHLIDAVVYRSSGVFLWAQIALKGIIRGIKSNDPWDQIQTRLKELPGDLMELFETMLAKLGDDRRMYEEEMAFYFNLVLDWDVFKQVIVFSTRRVLVAGFPPLLKENIDL